MASKLDDMEREELYKLYIKLQECKSEIEMRFFSAHSDEK